MLHSLLMSSSKFCPLLFLIFKNNMLHYSIDIFLIICIKHYYKSQNNKYQNKKSAMKGKLKQKNIESFLQDIDDFQFGEKEKFDLEQHMTPSDIAAKLLFYIYQNQPIENYVVMDIGVGTGMLTCGLIFIQAFYVMGIEVDKKYLQMTNQMLEEKVQGGRYELFHADARHFELKQGFPVDLVVMNPPFGTKTAGIDVAFLDLAIKSCRGNIYSMHKSSTRSFLEKFCEQRGYHMEVLFEVKFPLKKRFKNYHKKNIAFTQVDVIKLTPHKKQ